MSTIIKTDDGSDTLYNDMAGQTYHSTFGAIQESNWIFIERGVKYHIENFATNTPINVLEIGFGTGLNALLTAKYAESTDKPIEFTTIELYPIPDSTISQLNYGTLCYSDEIFQKIHQSQWSELPSIITPHFAIRKLQTDIDTVLYNMAQDTTWHNYFDIVMFDAFSPEAQPHLWTSAIFKNIYSIMRPNGVLTTYCAKGDVRRALISADFIVEKLQGPPGKRHILRAHKHPKEE